LDSITPMTAHDRPSWASALTDPDAFAREQEKLGRVWTVLGVTTDIANDNDWFRATLGGRSVFVQRFGDAIKGFENVCRHRFFPLRTADKGNGVIRCGFHHWQYNKDGLAVGIPHCQDLFGMTPRELDARLRPVEIATCGLLIFGRFAAPHDTETLEEFLGDGFAVLQAFCGRTAAPHTSERAIAANWKICFHITLDDYHIVAVHPNNLGKHGYIATGTIRYFRFGRHSIYMSGTTEPDAFARMAAACRDGTYTPGRPYRMLNIFPNLTAAIVRTLDRHYITLHQYVPVAADRTVMRSWFFPASFPRKSRGLLRDLLFGYAALWLPLAVRYFGGRVAGEDQEACERLQSIADQVDGPPILGRQEERIAWFEDAYAEAMAATPAPPASGPGAIVRNTDRVVLIDDQVARDR
jgi:phenylpropionate dioxygenase-like ring-hydroxylating dioxygenase large terminal subunit